MSLPLNDAETWKVNSILTKKTQFNFMKFEVSEDFIKY